MHSRIHFNLFFQVLGFALLSLLVDPLAEAATYANAATTYSWIPTSSHTLVDARTTPYMFTNSGGCGTNPPIIDDTITNVIPIGFNFVYGSMVFDSIRIMSNGRIHFVDTTTPPLWDNATCGYGSPVTQIPYPDSSLNYTMRIYGNDLDPSLLSDTNPNGYSTPCVSRTGANACFISFGLIGSAPNRQFVVTWSNVPEWASFSNATGQYNLQLILNEDGSFIFQYGTDIPGPQAALAQVGWQLTTSDYDTPAVGYPVPNTAIKYFIPHPVVEYLMEQASWSGAGSVLDTGGYSRNGSPVGTAQTMTSGKVCRGATFSATGINAINSGISVPTLIGNSGTIGFWYKANTPWENSGPTSTQDALLLDATTVNNQWFYLTRRGGTAGSGGGRLRFVFTDSAGTARVAETASITVAANTWEYIAVTWNLNNLSGGNNDRMTIYVNGVQQQQLTFTSTTVTLSTQIGNLFIGGTNSSLSGSGPNGTNNSADATIDEFRAYNYEATASAITNIMNLNTGGCLNHYAITDAGTGLTCQLSQVTVLPQTASNNPYTDNALVSLTTSDGTGTWALLNGHGVFNSTGSNSGTATYLFNGETQVVLGLTHTTAGTVSAHVTDGTYSDTSSTPLVISLCAVGKFNACEVTTPRCAPAALPSAYANLYTKLANTAFALDLVAVQVGGGLDTSFSNKMVKVNLLANSTAPTINTSNNCPTSQVSTIPLNGGAAVTLTSGRPPVGGISVSTTAFSSISPKYSAYGDVRVQFVCDSTNCPPSGGTWCATDAFTVRPQYFTVSSTANADSTNGTSSTNTPVVKAGTTFPLSVDSGAAGYNGYPSVTLTQAAWSHVPSGGKVGTLAGSFPAATVATGISTGNFTYDEVGYFNLPAAAINDSNYASISGDLGNGDCISGTGTSSDYSNSLNAAGKYGCSIVNQTATSYFGRFIPDHFDTVVVASDIGTGAAQSLFPMAWTCPTSQTCPSLTCPAVTNPLTCSSTYNGFVYSGQPFSLKVTAMNFGGVKTSNYVYNSNPSLSWAKTATLSAYSTLGGATLVASGSLGVTSETAFAAGTLTDATEKFIFNTSPTAPANIYIRAADTDGVTSLRAASVEGGVVVASGQLKVSNAYGSELLPLTISATAQFYNGGWSTSSTDGVTSLTFPASYLIGAGSTNVTRSPSTGVLSGGVLSLSLSPPGANNVGKTSVAPTAASQSLIPYLPLVPSSGGTATFGIYKGNNSIIYMHENY